jgi:hypothetical protein
MKNLVVVMAGDRSLHPLYAQQRDFALWVIYYGNDDALAAEYQAGADLLWRHKGLKIELVRRVLLEELVFRRQIDFSEFDFILLPDDDIEFPNGAADVSRLFAAARTLQADVFQPAIANEHVSVGWDATRVMPGYACHRTNIVEVMMHGFSGATFAGAYLPAIHAMEFMRSGWGIEPIWMKLGEAQFRRQLRTYVIDAVPAIHTRPVGSGATAIHQLGVSEAFHVPQIELHKMRTLACYRSLVEAVADAPEVAPDAAQSVSERFLRHRRFAYTHPRLTDAYRAIRRMAG